MCLAPAVIFSSLLPLCSIVHSGWSGPPCTTRSTRGRPVHARLERWLTVNVTVKVTVCLSTCSAKHIVPDSCRTSNYHPPELRISGSRCDCVPLSSLAVSSTPMIEPISTIRCGAEQVIITSVIVSESVSRFYTQIIWNYLYVVKLFSDPYLSEIFHGWLATSNESSSTVLDDPYATQ